MAFDYRGRKIIVGTDGYFYIANDDGTPGKHKAPSMAAMKTKINAMAPPIKEFKAFIPRTDYGNAEPMEVLVKACVISSNGYKQWETTGGRRTEVYEFTPASQDAMTALWEMKQRHKEEEQALSDKHKEEETAARAKLHKVPYPA